MNTKTKTRTETNLDDFKTYLNNVWGKPFWLFYDEDYDEQRPTYWQLFFEESDWSKTEIDKLITLTNEWSFADWDYEEDEGWELYIVNK